MNDIPDFSYLRGELLADGYERRAPTPEIEEHDRELVEGDTCDWCGNLVAFEPYSKGRSYRAFAVCHECDSADEI